MKNQVKPTFTGNWDKWLDKFEKNLKERGYSKYKQDFQGSDCQYWKVFPSVDDRKYQVGVLFYDFRKYCNGEHISVGYYCMTFGEDRIDMVVSKNIDLPIFEQMAEKFYKAMKQYMKA